MSIVNVYRAAWRTLGIEPGADRRGVKRAYRRQVMKHPPDRDPAGYQQIRQAYELLQNEGGRAQNLLVSHKPMVPPPQLISPQVEAGATALAILRDIAGQLDGQQLLELCPPEGGDNDDS